MQIPLILKNQIFPHGESCVTLSLNAHNKFKNIFQEKILNSDIYIYNEELVKSSFYKKMNRFELKTIHPDQYYRQLKFIYDKFFPLTDSTETLCEMGCASGELTQFFSLHFKKIEAFDFSPTMIATAVDDFKKMNIDNTAFQVSDITTHNYDKVYDCFCLMGVLTYVLNDKTAYYALKKIYDTIKPGAYLLYKDNVNDTPYDYYFYGPQPDYETSARSKTKILSFFENNNFKLIEETVFHNRNTPVYIKDKEYPSPYSYGAIFQKI